MMKWKGKGKMNVIEIAGDENYFKHFSYVKSGLYIIF